MEILEQILNENLGTKSVNLEFLEIEDLEEMMPALT